MWFDGMLSMPSLKSGYDDSAMIQWRKKMFFVQMNVDGKKMYLYNHRLSLHLPDYARRFKTEISALRFMKRHKTLGHCSWRIVEIPDQELQARRYLNLSMQ